MIVVWRVTQDCNLSCPFCSYDRTVRRPRQDASVSQIVRFGRLLRDFQNISADRVLVSWIGGEPLLWPPLEALTVLFTEELGLKVSTTTNGTTLSSPRVRRYLVESYQELTISIDGIGKAHDELRGWRDGYNKLALNVCRLAAEKRAAGSALKLRVNVVLMRDTFDQFRDLCLELSAWGIEEITFNQLGGNDRPDFFRHNRLDADHAEWLEHNLPSLRKELMDCGLELRGGPDYLRRIRASVHDQKLPVEDCAPGEGFLFVDEHGRIAPCSFTAASYWIAIDELVDVDDLAGLPGRFRARRGERRAQACGDCHSTHVFGKFATT
jgi:MoaA/NifB/PqqE/SkfB family radical SAM enzyme